MYPWSAVLQGRPGAGLCLGPGSPESARDLSQVRVARVSPCLVSRVTVTAAAARVTSQHGLFLGSQSESPDSESARARRRAFQVKCQRGQLCQCLGSPKSVRALSRVAEISPGLVSESGPSLTRSHSHESVVRRVLPRKRIAADSLPRPPESTMIDDDLVSGRPGLQPE